LITSAAFGSRVEGFSELIKAAEAGGAEIPDAARAKPRGKQGHHLKPVAPSGH
jgi:hypothetical protein